MGDRACSTLAPRRRPQSSSHFGVGIFFSAQARHSTTPRMLHTTQTKVPHFTQGYPSDARSSLPQARHVIASRSRRLVMHRSPCPARGTGPLPELVFTDLLDQRRARDSELARRPRAV